MVITESFGCVEERWRHLPQDGTGLRMVRICTTRSDELVHERHGNFGYDQRFCKKVDCWIMY